jgi:hypothetical protein
LNQWKKKKGYCRAYRPVRENKEAGGQRSERTIQESSGRFRLPDS